ncbi:MAG: amino acid adenylation domain-containing protein, partial [Dokdonia sp.]
RNEVDSGLSFNDFLATVQEDTLMAFDHQLYQYEELVDALDLSRDTSRNPLFDVLFSFHQQSDDVTLSDSDLKIVSHYAAYKVAKFDLELDVIDQGDHFNIVFSYSLSLFEEKTIRKFSKYLEKIIIEVVSDKNVKLSEIDILSKEEKDQILYKFNTPEVDYNIKNTIVDLIETQISLNPQAIALYFKGYTMEYGELNRKVNQLAHYLIDVTKVKNGDQVGLYLGRSPEMIIGFLAILKSGATYVPLDPENPSDRINMLIEDSEMKLILTNLHDDLLNIEPSIKIVDLISEASHIEEMPDNDLLVVIKGSDPAYIIFTSGSTGRPKGVVIEHDSLVDYSITFKEYFSLTSSDKVIQQASPSFDTVVEEVFPALLSGASIVIMPEGGRNIESLIEGIKLTKATVLSTVPIVLNTLNNYADDLRSLRLIISGGDLLLPRHIDKLISNYEVFNTYGPSESTVCITYHKISSLENTSCIGNPIANRQVYILDRDRQLCPVGVVGELCVSGKGLAKGYLNDNKLTEDKFIENPINPGSRIYRTGDAASWNPDGTIEFFGRIDDQVKIRGIRIELGEIESQLERIDFVSQALAVVHGSEDNKQLIAYLCGEEELNQNEVRKILSSRLPDYMIPTGYIWLDSFPLNANGKIDKRGLPNPDLIASDEYVAATNKDQEKLVAIWSEVLGIEEEKISVNSDFFRLGGHSLLAMKLRYLINKEYGVELPLSGIFLTPTILSLAEKLKEGVGERQDDEIVIPINNIQGEDKLFMIHDGSGEIDGYLELSRRIEGYSCYGIKFGLFDEMVKAPEIAEIASKFIKEIKKVQEVGPYQLLGWSLGGEIAKEITVQLENEGEKVENLIIVDSSFNFNKPTETIIFDLDSETRFLESRFNYCIKNQKSIHSLYELWSEFSSSEIFKKESIEELRNVVPNEIKELIPSYLNMDKKEFFDAVNKIRLLLSASEGYFIQNSIQARTLYIWPNESRAIPNKEKLKHFFVNFDLRQVSGNHFSVMKDPNVLPLSNIINNRLLDLPY